MPENETTTTQTPPAEPAAPSKAPSEPTGGDTQYSPGVERRFRELTQERNQLRESLTNLTTSLSELQAQQKRHVMERDLWRAELEYDDDILDFLELKHSKAKGEDGKQPSFGKWLNEYAPKAAFLNRRGSAASQENSTTGGETETSAKADAKKPETKRPPKAPQARTPAAAATQLTEDQVLELAKSDPKAYGEWRKSQRKGR